jgi:CPA1 family monovalent cation:H+ antiporter
MVINLIELLFLVVFASILQKNYKIPSPITLISSVLLAKLCGFNAMSLNDSNFDKLVVVTLPLLIASDALKLKWEDLKKHGTSLFWVAVVIVICSVIVGVVINPYVLGQYNLSIPALVMLFCMVSATDPITVSAIFNNFKVPHKLKILTEGESLFNDATALIIFSIAMIALSTPEKISLAFITMTSFKVIIGALVLGLIMGVTTIWALRLSDEAFVEATILLLCAYSSYVIAEHFHFSGILAIIISLVVANKKIQSILNKDEKDIDEATGKFNISMLNFAITSRENHTIILRAMEFLSMFASAALFIAIAVTVNYHQLLHYSKEILSVFAASTVIRAIMMVKFALVSNNVSHMQSINKNWWSVLTFAGSKGALSILMVHMIPNSFKYKEMFEHIIVGNILLSTFIYAAILAVIFMVNKEKFAQECLEETH